jgi:hypothetical protein
MLAAAKENLAVSTCSDPGVFFSLAADPALLEERFGEKSQLGKNSRLGFERWNRTRRQGESEANCKTVLRIAEVLVESSVGYRGSSSSSPPVPQPHPCPASAAAVARVNQIWSAIQTAADAYSLDPALLGAIALRETRGRNIAQEGGMGMGYFQIDIGKNPSVTEAQAYNPAWAANFAANMLAHNAASLGARFGLNGDALTQATAASYNEGLGGASRRLRQGQNPDLGTTGKDYGSNVLALMNCF